MGSAETGSGSVAHLCACVIVSLWHLFLCSSRSVHTLGPFSSAKVDSVNRIIASGKVR